MKFTNVTLASQAMQELRASRGRSMWREPKPAPAREPARRRPVLRLLFSRA